MQREINLNLVTRKYSVEYMDSILSVIQKPIPKEWAEYQR